MTTHITANHDSHMRVTAVRAVPAVYVQEALLP